METFCGEAIERFEEDRGRKDATSIKAVISATVEWMDCSFHYAKEKREIKSTNRLRNVKGAMHVSGLLDAEAQLRRKVLLVMAYVAKQEVEIYLLDIHDTLFGVTYITDDVKAHRAF